MNAVIFLLPKVVSSVKGSRGVWIMVYFLCVWQICLISAKGGMKYILNHNSKLDRLYRNACLKAKLITQPC